MKMDEKKEYVSLDCSVILFDNEDIVTASSLSLSGFSTDPNSNAGDVSFDNWGSWFYAAIWIIILDNY